MAQSGSGWRLSKKHYGPLWKYVRDDEVTNIDWDSGQLWIQYANRVRQSVDDKEVTEDFMMNFAYNVGNHAGSNFNMTDNIIMTETDNLRVTCVHPSFSLSGVTISIRKSLPKLRFNTQMALDAGYCEEKTMHLLINCVLAKMNLMFGGEPGKGKTESAKFFSSFIPATDKVVTVEDVREWHYNDINPGKSCVELKVKNHDEYEKALTTSVRLNPSWQMLGETRGREVRYLLEAWTNGTATMTTLHIGKVADIVERVMNMYGTVPDVKSLTDQIYNYVGVGLLMDEVPIGNGDTKHIIAEVGFFYRENGENKVALVVEDGVLHPERLPKHIEEKIKKRVGCDDVFYCSEAYNCTAPLVGQGNSEDEDDLEDSESLDEEVSFENEEVIL